MLEQIAAYLGAKKGSMIVAALIGSGIAALRASHLPIGARVGTFLGGLAASVYLSGPVAEWLGVTSDAQAHGIGFVMGLIGMTLIEAVMTLDWKSIISKRAGGQ